MFRNVRFYSIDSPWADNEDALSRHLEAAGFEPCGPLTEKSSGFVPVWPDAGEALARRVNGADLMKLRIQSRVLPAAAVAEELDNRIAEFRERMGEEPNPREKRRLKAETRDELMPKAMLKSDRLWGYYDLKEKLLAIDTAGEPNAERYLRRLKAAFGDLAVKPLAFKEPVGNLLTEIFLGGAPKQFALGRDCRMQDASDPKSVVRWSGFDLSDKSIRNHVAAGMHLTHLAVVYDNVASFTLDENGVISRLKFVGMDEDGDDDDALARLDTEFTLLNGTLRLLLGDLKKLLGGYA